MKFPSKNGKIISIRVDQIIARECYTVSLRIGKGKKETKPKVRLVACTSLDNNLGDVKLNPRKEELRAKPIKEVKPFQISKEPS